MSAHADGEALPRRAIVRLYVAGDTPNSVRAQRNLAAGLAALAGAAQDLVVEIIDVFVEPKKAMKDGVLVTPTLVASHAGSRTVIVGDLGDGTPLSGLLASLMR